MKRSAFLASLITLILVPHANAQLTTTVQLPTFRVFSVNTTVSVPDRGSVYLGGVNRTAEGSTRRGVPLLPNTNRSFGKETSTSGVRASAYIHDLDEMDRQIRGSVASSSVSSSAPPIQPAALDHRLARVSDIRQRVQARKESQLAIAHARIKDAVRLELQGKYAAAKTKYRAAYAHAKPEWQTKITQRLRKINVALDQQRSVASR